MVHPQTSASDTADNILSAALRQWFGYHDFRSLQREIVEASLAGADVVALLPTGGGKSLCYQLPALLREGLTVVISPLIALMKDQVDALRELGIAATYLNSSLSPDEASARWRELHEGQYRLLYLSPERLMFDGMLDALARWKVALFAIDEAHCVSEWGHDFRPEYRKLAALIDHFPHVPLMALTATATERVRDDLIVSLRLRNPRVFVASFNRPNLSYRVIPRSQPSKQIQDIVAEHPGESGIIYCMTRKRTEEVADALVRNGVPAVAYHAGLPSEERSSRQEQFIRDKVRIVVATVAFGMGIDKPDVRFVIHHDLPKNIESYYQETGRAGRDGGASECVLLYSPGDVGRLYHLIEEMSDEHEREVAREHLRSFFSFCESTGCRRVELLRYFGEVYSDDAGAPRCRCEACDNCLTPRESFDGTTEGQQLLSCVLRIEQKSGFNVGLQHLVDVLCGAQTEKIRKWEHDTLTTYGVGKGHQRAAWMSYARELMRLGLARQNEERFNVIEVTEEGRGWLRSREQLRLTKPLLSAKLSRERRERQKRATGDGPFDEELFQRLRTWRREMAERKRVPPYVIFHDRTLQEVARTKPTALDQLAAVSGVGGKKLEEYGPAVVGVVSAYAGEIGSKAE